MATAILMQDFPLDCWICSRRSLSKRRKAVRLRRIPTFVIVLAMTAAVGGCTAPRMIAPESTDDYYARASMRLGQTGSVVLHFSIGPDGKAKEPILHDEPLIVDPYNAADDRAALRLIESAKKYIRAAKFDADGIHKRHVTASFIFELKPCGPSRIPVFTTMRSDCVVNGPCQYRSIRRNVKVPGFGQQQSPETMYPLCPPSRPARWRKPKSVVEGTINARVRPPLGMLW
jgi:hypothetical protein